jgi:hypothetical protein
VRPSPQGVPAKKKSKPAKSATPKSAKRTTTARPKPSSKSKSSKSKSKSSKPATKRGRLAKGTRPEPIVTDADVEGGATQHSYVLVERDEAANPLLAKGSLVAVRREEIQGAPWSTRVETPFAERAAGAGLCVQCEASIARSSWQVVVSDDGATIHPGCAFAWTQEHLDDQNETSEWMETLVEHLSESDRVELLEKLTPD